MIDARQAVWGDVDEGLKALLSSAKEGEDTMPVHKTDVTFLCINVGSTGYCVSCNERCTLSSH